MRPSVWWVVSVVALVSGLATAQVPRLEARAAVWTDGQLRVDVDVARPVRSALHLGGPAMKWCDGFKVSVVSADGVEQKWALKRPSGCQQTISVDTASGAGVQFTLPAKAVARLPAGTYEVVVTLDLTHSGGSGFTGVVQSAPMELTLGSAKAQPPVHLPDTVAALVAALDSARTQARRRVLALGLEAKLLEAPLLPPGPALDAVLKAHLSQLARQMCTADEVYTPREGGPRASNHLLFVAQVLVSPGHLSGDFTTRLTGLPLGPETPPGFVGSAVDVSVAGAKDVPSFWAFVAQNQGAALHLFPVHARDGVARVATCLVGKASGPERFQHISFWRQEGGAWKSVSFEPLPPRADTRDWRDNLHRTRREKDALELTAVEKAQDVEAQFDLLRLTATTRSEAQRGGARLGTQLDRELLERRKGQGTPEQQAAVVLELSRLGTPPSTDTLLELVAQVQVGELSRPMTDLLRDQLGPKFKQEGRPATAQEQAEISALEPPVVSAAIKVVVLGDLAQCEVSNLQVGRRTLFRRGPKGWAKVTELERWVREPHR